MSDLPEIKFEKKKKKRGFLPWLRQKLGFGGGASGGTGVSGGTGAASNAANAANAAKLGNFANAGKGVAFGTAKIGASTGFMGGLVTAKGIAIAAVVAGGIGGGLYMSGQNSGSERAQSAFNSDKSAGSDYIPAALRQKNQGSSLDMFRSTNEGALGSEEAANAVKDDGSVENAEGEVPEGEAPEENANEDMDGASGANDMMAKLMGGGMGDLSSSMGGGSNKFSGMGGFGNKFGTGQVGPKVGFNNDVGAGFQDLPKFNAKKSKMLAANKRAVFSKRAAGKKGKYGKGAFNQSKGVKRTQTSYTGGTVDGMRSTQDAAWEGTTGGEVSTGGGGLGSSGGGGGIETDSKLDTPSTSGAGGANNDEEALPETIPDVPSPDDVSPWASLASQCMTFLMLSAVFTIVGGYLCSAKVPPWVYALGIAFCLIAIVFAGLAIANAVKIGTQYGQTWMGIVYGLGGVVAIASAVMAMTSGAAGSARAMCMMSVWVAAASLALGMIAQTMSVPGSPDDNIITDNEKNFDTTDPGNGPTEAERRNSGAYGDNRTMTYEEAMGDNNKGIGVDKSFDDDGGSSGGSNVSSPENTGYDFSEY